MDFYQLLGLVSVLPAIAGIVVAAVHLRGSRWAPLLLGGFAIEAGVGILVRVAAILISRQSMEPTRVQLLFSVAGLVGFAGNAAIVAGVAGLLSQLRAAAVLAAARED